MSRSRKRVSVHTWCVVNHRAESKYFQQRRRQYRRIVNHYVRTHWHDEDMILPSRLPLYNKWLAPSDGRCIQFYPPQFENPFNHTHHYHYTSNNLSNPNNWTKHPLPIKTELELYIQALHKDYTNLQWYEKCFRK